MFPNIELLVRLILVVPPTTATAERSFSGLRRILTWLRSSTAESRLTHLAVLHLHRDIANEINLIDVCNNFIHKENRVAVYGKF